MSGRDLRRTRSSVDDALSQMMEAHVALVNAVHEAVKPLPHECDNGSLHLTYPTADRPYPDLVAEKPERWAGSVPCPHCDPDAARGAMATNKADAIRATASASEQPTGASDE